MTPLFKKLNLKDQAAVTILNAPASFDAELSKLKGVAVKTTIGKSVELVLAFAVKQAELDKLSRTIGTGVRGDAVVWITYPKGSSKNYSCEFNRDTGWDVLGQLGFEPVRQVAIDADWSALRFRRTNFIKSLTRSGKVAISPEGKRRTRRKN